jgi:hypothetical protein
VPLGAQTMARPKKGTEKDPDERVGIIHIKGTRAYAEWLEALNRKTHIPKAALFRLAMAEWAERNGHPAPPEF